jgi:hypothetical protein
MRSASILAIALLGTCAQVSQAACASDAAVAEYFEA